MTLASCAAPAPTPTPTPTPTPQANVPETPANAQAALLASLQARYASATNGEDILFWTAEERRVGFAHIDSIYPTRTVTAGEAPLALPTAPADLSALDYRIEDTRYSLDDFLAMPESIGLLVVRDGRVILEDYAEGHGPDTPWMSFSVTKSVTSMLVGAAIQDGYIGSVDDAVTDYLPQLRGSGYDGVSIANVLQMASGVAWNEDYEDPESDVALAGGTNGINLYRHLATLPRAAEPGTTFNYNTGESNLVGALLRAAIGNNASSYLQMKIWQPFGMADDAHWVITPDTGAELGGCCLNATLRDYARIGLFALNDGVLADGTRVLPEGWMAASVTPSPGADHYGYQWWLAPGDAYSARGIFGQLIFIDPDNNLVIAMHSNAAFGSGYGHHIQGVIRALRAHLAD
ncbi:beta-lactamase family protein [Marinihelvus fidelis]|uniref:Beta-lactamase family protein n=2 Tax=Marinihelvus fidelis TaxID=2613842 RepID=A0A5N0TCU3_9GAMM|nr:beta-lactamase family protein [Marinihelvus fidelis]